MVIINLPRPRFFFIESEPQIDRRGELFFIWDEDYGHEEKRIGYKSSTIFIINIPVELNETLLWSMK